MVKKEYLKKYFLSSLFLLLLLYIFSFILILLLPEKTNIKEFYKPAEQKRVISGLEKLKDEIALFYRNNKRYPDTSEGLELIARSIQEKKAHVIKYGLPYIYENRQGLRQGQIKSFFTDMAPDFSIKLADNIYIYDFLFMKQKFKTKIQTDADLFEKHYRVTVITIFITFYFFVSCFVLKMFLWDRAAVSKILVFLVMLAVLVSIPQIKKLPDRLSDNEKNDFKGISRNSAEKKQSTEYLKYRAEYMKQIENYFKAGMIDRKSLQKWRALIDKTAPKEITAPRIKDKI